MADATPAPLTELYVDWLQAAIDEKGVELPHGIIRCDDNSLIVMALAVPTQQAYEVMLAKWAELGAKEMIFALDRFTKDGQGTTPRDVMAGHYCTRQGPTPFIIEYQHAPRIVKPIEWGNAFWNHALNNELLQILRGRVFGAE